MSRWSAIVVGGSKDAIGIPIDGRRAASIAGGKKIYNLGTKSQAREPKLIRVDPSELIPGPVIG